MYSARIDGEPTTFGTSGLLYRSNKLMYDRTTNSIWNQFTGEPVIGPLAAVAWTTPARIDAEDEGEGGAALNHLAVTLRSLRGLRCRRLVVPVGAGDLPGVVATRGQLQTATDPVEVAGDWRSRQGPDREAAVDRLVRRLDALARK